MESKPIRDHNANPTADSIIVPDGYDVVRVNTAAFTAVRMGPSWCGPVRFTAAWAADDAFTHAWA